MVKLKGMMLAAMGGMLMGLMACGGQQWSEQQVDSFMLVTQKGGPSLGYSPQSGVKILTIDGYAFKDLNRNDSLDAYEDWRLSPQERAADLASQLSIEEIAGLMLYSSHQAVPMIPTMGFGVCRPSSRDWIMVSQPTQVPILVTRQRPRQNIMQVLADKYLYGLPHSDWLQASILNWFIALAR